MTISTLDPWKADPLEPDDGVFVFPASFAQQRLWFLDQLAPGSPVYNLPFAWRLRGPLDDAALEWALAEIVARHEPLRTTFTLEEREPVQVVAPPGSAALSLTRVDLSDLPPEQREGAARRLAAEEALRPFDLERGPLFRAVLARLNREDHALLVTFHHIVSDGWSLGVFLGELSALYRGEALPDLPIQYADWAAWQRDFLDGPVLERELAWWKARLEGAPRVLELPFRARPAVSAQRGAWRSAEVPRRVADAMREVGQSEGATRFMTLLAAFEVLLHLCTGQEDLVVGTPVSGRTQVETEGLIGLFVNTLALRTELAGARTFRELLAQVRETALGAFGHQDLPFERLVEELQPERSLAHNPIVQVTFSLQERGRDRGLELEGLRAEPLGGGDRGEGTAKFDLALFVEETPRGVRVRLDWDADLLEDAEALRLLESYRALLDGIAEDPWRPLWSLPILPETSRHQLLVEWNDTASPRRPRRETTLAERFAAQAARTPGAVALVHGEERLTYEELDRRSNRLARRLLGIGGGGVGPESRVGVALERTPDLIAALLAVLKAGGAYVPLDPAYPRERLALIREDAGCAVVVDRDLLRDLDREDDSPLPGLALPGNLAYLIYTSGSTGRPKGVAIEHRSAAALLDWAAEVFALDEVVLASTSMTFDLSVFEVFLPLTRGGRVVLAENALALPELEDRDSVTLVNTVPSAISALVGAGGLPASVRTVNLAGEPLKRALVDRLYAVPTVEAVYNLYGPSEDTTYSTWVRVPRDEDREPAIGVPVSNTRAHVLDRWLRPLPVGVPGELFLGGAGLARGYLNRPDLTAASFVPDPWGDGGRLYRTGDLVRRRADGHLEFLGRIDHQVKVRGFRIELGEVESNLLAHPAVREAVVLALGEGGDRSLVAYVVPARSGIAAPAGGGAAPAGVEAPPSGAEASPAGVAASPAGAAIHGFLAERLPAYMIPSGFVLLDSLPLTPNGKVDRKALAALAPARGTSEPSAIPASPRTATEELIAALWADVLRVERVGVHDSFFDLGGHSLLATRLVSRVREVFRADLPLRALFEAPTVAGLAARVESARRSPLPPVVPVPRDRDLPASFAQERLWFLEQLGGEGTSYNLPAPLRLRGPLSVPALRAALDTLVERHESLRTTFALAPDGTVLQRIAPAAGLSLPLVEAPEAEARRLALEDARRPFDLENGPLVRATLLRLAPDDHVLLLTVHHVVSDGWSMRVLVRELEALTAGSPPPPLPVQYADFAVWQRNWLSGGTLEAEISWWRERLAGAPAVLELPADRPRPAVRTPRGAVAGTVLPAELAAGLDALARRSGATPFMTLLAAFQVLLRRYAGRDDLTVGTPIANRNRTETEGLVGFFVNTLVLRGDLSGDPTFREALRRTRETALGAYDHQDVPFEKLVEALQPERSLGHTPLFQVMFLHQSEPADDAGFLSLGSDTAKFDLTLAVSGLNVRAEYSRDLFDAPTVLRLLGHFRVLLEGIAADPERRLSELPLLGGPERHALLFEENDTAVAIPDRPVHELFEEQVRRTPERVAVTCEGRSLTYAELNARANRIAHHLRRLGAGPEVRVGVSLERSPDLIAGLLGILKAGAAYLPLDPSLPAERLAFLMADGGVSVVVDREEIRTALAAGSDADPESGAGPRSLAYVLYTSGSTGVPKGVEVEHRSIIRLVRGANFAELGDGETFLQLAPVPFDASTLEIWAPLLNGGRLIVFPPHTPSLEELGRTLAQEGISTLWLTAGLFHQMAEAQPEALRGVRQLLAGGDALSVPHVRRVLGGLEPGHRLINGYGPTENTTFTCCWSMDGSRVPGSSVPIGRPVSNTRVHLLGRDLEPVPLGVPGELYAAGDGLARGYLGRPDLTAERFVPSPMAAFPGERLYRTGDLARRLPSGEIEFLGRLDTQVKLRGFRIELGEIEAALCSHPEVREAAVLVREDRLVACVAGDGTVPPKPELRAFLSRKLPDYMVPAAFVVLDALPLTPNGKVDRRALAAVEPGRPETAEETSPRDGIEVLLAGIWCQVLGLQAVGVHDGFFNLGGHSLLATRVVSRVREVFGAELPLRALFESPTVAGLAERLRRERISATAPPIVPRPREGNPPASFAQERLWFLDRFGTDRASYNLPSAIRLWGRLDRAALAAALSEIVRRHEALRTSFDVEGEAVVQVIGPATPLPLPVVDLRGIQGSGEAALRLAREEARRPFDLSRGPLARAALLRTGDEEHLLLLSLHHIVSDGWSVGVMLRELSALYRAFLKGRPSPLPELPVQYADFAVWQREWLQGEVLERQLGWWRSHLAGAPPVLELPADRPRPSVQSGRGGRFPVALPAELRDGVQALARRQGATPFMALLVAFQALLGRLTHRDDVPVGTPIAGRNRAETEGLIGFFVNTLVLRADLAGDPAFRDLLGRSREATLAAYAVQDLPFEKLVEELQPERSLAHPPLFQVMFVLQNAPMEDLDLPGLSALALAPATGTNKFDLHLALMETAAGLVGDVVYNRDLFDEATARRMAGIFERLLAAAVADPEAPLSSLPLLGEAEVQHLLREWNDTRADWDLERPLHGWIEEQVRRAPDAPAVTFEGETLTYRELDERSGRLAARLRRLGAGPESRVGIAAERSLELVVGLLGILKAGAAYVPLDPSYPAERLAFMLEDSQGGMAEPVLLTQQRLAAGLPPHRGRVVLLDSGMEQGEAAGPVEVLPEHPAYVIYTSGSTGRPKGAVNTHRAIVNRLVWMQEAYGLTAGDVVLQKTPYSFDVSVWEFFWPLMVGARLVVARPGGHQDSAYLAELIRREGVTTLHFVPSMLQVFLEQPGVESCTSLRRVICSGEALPFELQQRFFAKLEGFTGLHNLYGPTEAAVDVTVWACEPGGARPVVPIGRPISNLRIHMLDRSLRLVPVGVPGELHIGGVGLARGYLNRPALTAERFVPDPLGEPGSRLYKSGDLCRHLPDGRIEYLGRLDHQVKIRGFRIELGEIEAALCAHPSVKEAVVLAREDRPGDKRLVAYLTEAGELSTPELRRHLSASLPEYMVPSAFVVLPALPLSPNGKVDRKVLPAPETEAPADRQHVAPRTPLEQRLAELWRAPLGLERVGIHDNFFALGGNSISGAVLINRLQEELGEIVHVVVIFDAPTVESMARYLAENHAAAVERIWGAASLGAEGAAAARLVRPGAGTASIPRREPAAATPLSFAQERLWFLAQLEPDSPFYNIPVALRLTGRLDVPALARSLSEIRRRHEGLRTVFASGTEGSVQIVVPHAEAGLPEVDLDPLPAAVREAEASRLAQEEARRPFDLKAGPLLRTVLLRLDRREHALLSTMHHIVSDGWSMGVFLSELGSLYGGLSELPELPIQYADFALWQRERLRGAALEEQLAWWHERLAGAPALLELPTDRPRPAVQRFRGGQVAAGLGDDLAERLTALGRRRSATLFMTLLAGFQALLSCWSGQEDVSVGSPVAGRLWPETEPLIGFFVNTLVLRTRVERDTTFDELLARVQRGTIEAFAHQEIPFEKIVEELQPGRSLARSPLFQVLFAFQNAPRRAIDLPGLEAGALQSGGGTAKFDLSLGLAERDGRIGGAVEYDADLFDPATVARLLGGLETLLRAAAEDPDRRISDLPLLTEAERRQLQAWNGTGSLWPDVCLHQRFEAQVDLTPEAEALVWGNERLSYAELDLRANRLARRLRRLGVGPEARVGIALERSAELIVGLLAILKAGGAYVPLDPAYPRERLALIREDAECAVVVDRDLLRDLDQEDGGRLPGLALPGNLAYLIYTSGSTGRPKGVAIEHRSAAALLAWAEREFATEELSGVLASTSITFDLSVFELFLPLARGGRVILAENALALPDLPARNEVRLINTVPSAIAELVRLGAVPESVRTVNLAGEPLKRALADRIYALPHVERVYNLYGPSEDTTYSTFVPVPRGGNQEPTIGAPIAGTRAWVVDRGLRPLPLGVPGELCLAGEGLARDYLNRADLTAASFVPDPFGGVGERVYRTGDLARWSAAGELEFLGRIDHQVKVRGFRIELGEVEAALCAHPAVLESVVLALGEGGERRLVAYVAPDLPSDLRAWLESRLPAYMVPSSFVVLPGLPLTPNGKVDRMALARIEPEREPAVAAAPPPLSPVEDLLAGIWCEVLRRGSVAAGDGFFELGGHSLLATQVVSRVRDVLGVELPLRALFETPTLAGLAARIEEARTRSLDLRPPAIVPVPRGVELRASFAQERLWFLDRFGSDRASYNLSTAIHLRGRLDPAALAAALSEIVRRHESLRTAFAVASGGVGSQPRVLQVIGPAEPLPLPRIDLRGLPDRAEEMSRLAREEARRPFDLSRGPLARATLLRTGEDEHTLLLTQHHIVSDAWSIGVFLRELTALYGAAVEGRPSALPDLPVQYADFAAWQRSWLRGEVLARQLGWWRDHLAGAPAVLELPADRPRPPVPSGRGGRFPLGLPAHLRAGVQALARRQGATPFMALLAAFQALVGRLAGQDDVPVGTPIAGRSRAETEGLIGFFVNTLVLRGDLSGDPPFLDLLGRARESLLGAYGHQDLPFEKLVEELHPERSLAHSPLFQVMFILQNAPMEALELPGVTALPVVPDTGTTKFDLRLALTETAESLVGSVLYNLDLFDAATARRMADGYETLLAAAVADPGARLSDLPLLREAEVHHLLREWNDTRVDWDLERPLHGWIEEQARRTPDAPALTFEGETLTYRDLDERAGRLAARLRRLGAGPETRIGISAERSLELVVGLLGILKSGACYVPIDPSYPPERLAFMVEDSQQGIEQPILLTRESLVDAPEPEAPRPVVLPKHPAYVIYTSGSTGRPKGAVNTHEAIVNRLVWMQAEYGLTSGDVVLQKTPFSFDVSVWEFFWPLMVGARLVVARPGGHQDSAYLADLIRREGVTTLHFVPSMLQVFLEQPGVETCTSLRRVICSGEALPFELQQRFFAKLGGFAGLHNLYGPTEAAVDVSVWACAPGGRPVVPIGRPISNLRIHILDRSSRPVPMNVPGELYIAGVGLARGYLNRPPLTAERFVPDPFGAPGSRLYKSGDLCRHLPDGRIEYLGRLDHQVKIRGFRIELGEIEAALCAHPSVKEAVALAREDRPGDKRLVAYLTAEAGEVAVPELRRHLLAALPEYMVPSAFVVLPAMPLSPNGKVDRKLLPAPETAATAGREYMAPRTPLEEYLAGLWKAPLGLERVGIHDDFFALGGNSISGAILINQLQERLGEIVHVVVIFDAPTVERMADYLVESYPEAVARIWGRESLGTEDTAAARLNEAARAAGRIGDEEVARLRAIITPLAPLATDEPKNPPAVFVLSPPRSGSTLLRVMLAGHPRLFAPPELELLNFNTLADRRAAYTGRDSFSLEGLIRAVMEVRGCGADEAAETVEAWERDGWTVRRAYHRLQEWLGDRILIDKTPSYPLDLEILRRAESDFEGARYVHLLRHPYGMIRSFEEARLEQVFFRYNHPFTRRELAELIWLISQENILRFLDDVPAERRHLVRFEDLVRDPEPVLRGICGFLGLDFELAMLRPYEDRSRRMTDGLHAESRMLGDVKFHSYSGVDASTAERWREAYREDFLGFPAARMAAALGYEVRAGSTIPRRAWKPGEPRPLSFSQERLWFLGQFDPDSSFYNITSVLRFAGRLNVPALERSLDAIRRRHEVLRTVFSTTPAGPVQIVTEPPAVGLPVIDLAGLPDGLREREISRVARAEGWRPFDLAADPMLRTPMLRLGDEDHAVVVAMHHIASDGWSMGVILSELSDLYESFDRGLPSPLPELPIQYADFAVWQRGRLSGEALERETAWWREALAGAPTLIQLPTDRPRPAVQRFRGSQVQGFLPDDLATDVTALGRRHGATSFMSLVAAFQALLARISGEPEVLVGTPIAGRNWPETQDLVGFFINTLVVRGDLGGNPSYRELIARSRRTALGAFAHQEIPFEKLVEELQPERSLTHSPIFQVMFALQNLPPRRFELPGLEITAYSTGGGTSKFDLNLLLTELDGRLLGTLEYNSDLFDRSTAQRLFGSFETLLRGLVGDPDRCLSDTPLIGEAERHQMLLEWNDTEAPFPRGVCLHQPFEVQAAARPEAVAAVFEGRVLTYGELDRRANRLAHRLRSSGVGPGRLVAVHLERSPEMLVAVLGIHKAGGAYVPVEVSWPADRLRYILESERIGHVVTQASRLEALPPGIDAICPDELEGLPDFAPEPSAGPEDPAYIIFTSGSTGRPKGVMVRHRPAVNLIHWVNTRFGVGPSDTVLFVTALSFDLSVYDIFGVLAAGGTVRIATPAELRDPEALVKILLEEPITFWDSAPAALQQLVSWLPAEPQPSAALRLAFNSGDWIPVSLPDRVRQTFPKVEFVSLGGATEATIWSNFFPVDDVAPHWVSIPYGRPIENARYHVLDAGLNPCPVGVPGDLYIAGGCLSDGYASAPDLTAQKYVPDPFGEEPGARRYRTGDRVRYWPDGNLEFLGRVDTQVKVRGFRIELGEIESVLMTHPAVREAVVLAREDTPGDQRLVAYLIPEGDAPDSLELRRVVQARLPDYMVPSVFVPLESWPLAATGKLDRKALPPPERAYAKSEAKAPVLPHNELERTIAEIWKEVVGLPEVGVRDNFFDVGGHSLLMARVHTRLEETLGRKISMVDLFQYPTIAALAAHLSPEEAPATVVAPPVVERRGEDIAVIGLAGRFPGARDVDELWRNLRDEVESIRTFTDEELRASGYGDEVLDPRFVKRRGALDGPDLFDAAFFEYSPREAQIIDPQQRHFLECAWEALENAGYGAEAYRQRVGVFAGTTENTYVLNLLLNPDVLRSMGRQQITISNNPDYLPTRVSYKLNLRGPSLNVQTACSTSLVAVHLARLSLLRGECEIALAGGVSVKPLEVGGYLYHEGGINSPDGHTRAFDARAQGVVGGSGLGVVVLKRLEDALADGDTIHAVIRGSAVNNDGSGKPGFTAPSVEGQAVAIREAHRAAGIEPGTIGYVEAHGTGTPMGDPIEAAALIQAFGETSKKGYCALGSIKTNIGHLDAAAGVAGLIKTVLALENRTIPASLHFERPNPKIPFERSPFYVAARTLHWPADGTPRRAGVSSFGIGGTNAHAVLEEAPEVPAGEPSRRPARLLVLSARTPSALDTATGNLADWLEAHPEASLDDVAFTLQVGRQPFRYRRAVVCGSREDAVLALRETEDARAATGSVSGTPSVVFLFPGQGSQYARMGAELYEREPVYRSALDRCCELLRPELGMDLLDLLHPERGQRKEADLCLARTSFTQPALFAVEYALARLWASWGIRPAAMLGHSIGEYVAACVAGVFSLEEALSLVAARGRLMQELPAGSMLGVSLPEDEVRAWIADRADRGDRDLSLAAVNAPRACVVSGPEGEIETLRAELEAQGVETRPLHTSHAFHSRMMEPILEPFLERVRRVNLQPPRLPYLSNVTGTWITPEQATDPEYWALHVRQAVRFADGVAELLRLPDPVLLETGPGRALSTLARQHPDRKAARLVVSSLSHAKDRKPIAGDTETVRAALGRLWVTGVDVDWTGFRADEPRRRVPLPTYPFERRSHWIGMDQGLAVRFGKAVPVAMVPIEETSEPEPLPAGKTGPRNPVEEAVAEVWRDLLGVDGIGVHDDFFELGGSSLMAVQLGSRLRQALSVDLPVDFLFQASSVAGVAEMVSRLRPEAGQPVERPRSSCLVPLQKGDGRRPLFLVHQVGGNVYTFRALAKGLGKAQPVFGLRSMGLEDGEEPLTRVEDMAEHYLELVRSVQPAGPYRIGGASMGGMVAFEMAHRLRAAGEAVELLALMDTPCGEQMPSRRLTNEDIVIAGFAGRVELTPEELLTLSPDEQISHAFAKARRAGTLPEDFDERGNRRRVRVLQCNVAGLYAYRPQPYAGRMVFFRAEERRPDDPPRPEIAWIDLARGGCDVLLVPGNHETMHEPPHVQNMAERLRGHLVT